MYRGFIYRYFYVSSFQMIKFTSSKDAFLFIWPEKKTIEVFLQSSGLALVKEYLRDFYMGMYNILSKMKTDVKDMVSELQICIDTLSSHLETYEKTSNVNEDFIM